MEDFKIYNVIGWIEGRIETFDDTNNSDAIRINECKEILPLKLSHFSPCKYVPYRLNSCFMIFISLKKEEKQKLIWKGHITSKNTIFYIN